MRKELKRSRLLADLTQKELAEILGVSQQTISKHELGHATPNRLAIIRKYEEALGVKAHLLFPDIFKIHI